MYVKIYNAITGFKISNDKNPQLIILGHNVLYGTLNERNLRHQIKIHKDGEFTIDGIRIIESNKIDEISLF